jgi:beta-lactamase class A
MSRVWHFALTLVSVLALSVGSDPALAAERVVGYPAPAARTIGHASVERPVPLRTRIDGPLQREVEGMLGDLGLSRPARDGRLAMVLVDLSDLRAPRVASVNGDRMMYAASLPKIAILLGAFVQIERGRMRLDTPTHLALEQMIRYSSNQAATAMLLRVGRDNLIDILRSDRFRFYDDLYGGLWVGKDYSKRPAYRRDPLHHLSHGATALQAARFYYLLETGALLSPALTREMKSILGRPGIRHKFVKGLEGYDATVYRKSGSW